jgi:tRNA pseudouridine32 synthase/23S rRNA pseudouridine746 synthase
MIQVVLENEHFIFCDKESGTLTTPSRFEEKDSRKCLGLELQSTLGQQIYPIHRLDFEVSGLVMFAKTAEAHRKGNHWFEHRYLQKTYRALTTTQDFSHIPEQILNPRQKINLQTEKHFEWKARILRGKRRAYESTVGKPSLTLAHFIGFSDQGWIRWDLKPVTGRSHQLRFDLSRHGFPILGDTIYGSNVKWKDHAIALRAFQIDFSKIEDRELWKLPKVIEVPGNF